MEKIKTRSKGESRGGKGKRVGLTRATISKRSKPESFYASDSDNGDDEPRDRGPGSSNQYNVQQTDILMAISTKVDRIIELMGSGQRDAQRTHGVIRSPTEATGLTHTRIGSTQKTVTQRTTTATPLYP